MDRLDGTSPKRARKDLADGPQQPKRRRTLGIMPLEPRIMYDGAAAATAAAASTAPHDAPAADAGRNTGPAPQDSASAPAARPDASAPTDHASALQAPTVNAASDAGSAAQPATAPSAIVFIDGNVPDLQDLVNGAKPGETVVVLDPSKDGVQQIADYLAANDVHGLAAIQIVSHGLEGEVHLGDTTLTDANLADHANALAGIGAALAPGGDILLYGCYVGHGDAGQQFVKDLASFTGANIAASSAPVGTTTDGINWNLDVSTGPIEAAVPFTDAALQSFDGTLPVTIDGQLFYLINNHDSQAAHINSDGSNATTFYANNSESTIAVDTAAGLIFTTNSANTAVEDTIIERNASTGAIIATMTFGPGGGDNVVNALTIDPFTHTLYVGVWGDNTDLTGVVKVDYNPLTGALTNNGFLFTATQTETTPGNDATAKFTDAQALYYDSAHQLLYYVDDDAGYNVNPFHPTNGVYVVSTAAGSLFQPTELTSNGSGTGQFPTSSGTGTIGVHGNIIGLTVDAADNIAYFLTTDAIGSPNNALWWVNTTGANQTATQITMPAGTTLTFGGQNSGEPGGLSFDAQTRQLYVSNQDRTSGGTKDLSFIAQLQLDASGHNVTLVHKFDVASLVGATPTTVDSLDTAAGTAFDILPVFTIAGTTTHAAEQGSFVDLTASNTSTDQDGNHYASATVQITGGTFTSNETSANDDHLAVLDGGVDKTSGKFGATNITIAYDSATEKLTLTGYDTIANYNAALAAVEYKTTGDNPTNYGNNTTRTISWTVSDGALNIPFGAQNSGTTTLNIDAVNDAPVNHLPASPSLNEDVQTAITGISITDVDANPASQNITVTLSVQHGTLNVLTNVANGITAPEITAGAQDSNSITITATQSQINTTLAANGLRYLGNLNYNGPETLHIVTSDNGNTGSGGAQTDTDDLSVTVLPVNDPPNLQPDTTTATTYTENAAPTALFAGEKIDSPLADVDSSANYAGGSLTVSITGGAVLGDRIALLASSGFTISAGNLLDAGNNIIGAISGNGSTTVTVSALTAAATPAVVDQLAQAFGFQNTTDDPGAGDRTITGTFNDGGNTGSGGAKTDSVTQTVHVAPVNDAPTLTATAANPTFTEAAGVGTQAAAVSVFSGANASTIEAGQSIVELDFTVSGLQDGANEKISFDGTTITLGANASGTTFVNGMAYTVTLGAGNASIALTKAAGVSVANIDTLINGITYQDTNTDNPTAGGRVFTLTSIKDNGGTANGGADTSALTVTSTVTVVPTNDAPVLAGAGNTISYAEQAAAIPVDSGVTLSDVDSPNLAGATVTISSGLQAGDTLHFTNQNGISGAYSGGVLTLTGSATVAQYQAALASVTFDNATNDDPTNGLASLNRTVTWQVNDGGAVANLSNTGTSTITVTPVNDAPVALATAGHNATEQVTLSLKNGGLSVSDVDGAGGSETATLSVAEGTLTVTSGFSGAIVSGSGSSTVTIQGTTAQINALLNTDATSTVRYTDSSDTPAASTTLTLAINDNGHTGAGFPLTGSAATQIVITAVDDAPVLTNVGPTASSTEQVFAVLDNNATASDVELNALNGGAGDYSGASLTIARHLGANAQDAYGFSTAGATFTVSGNALQAAGQTFATFASAGGVLTIDFTSTGTPATTALVNNVMQHVTYANQSDAPPASVTLDYTFSDGNTGAQGTGGAQTATGSTLVTITAVNDAPVNTVPAAQSTAENASLVFDTVHGNAISVSDADSGGLNETVTLSVLNGTLSLGSTAGLVSFTNNAATVTLTGTVAAINADLNGLTYHPGLNFVGSDTLTVVTNDNGHTGTGGALTDTDPVAINVTAATTATLDGQLSFLINNGTDSQAGHVNSDGSNPAAFYANNSESTIAVDTAAGLIFTTNAANAAFEDTITVHSATTGAVLATLTLGPGGGNDIVTALTIDPFSHTLFAGDWGNDASTTGVKTISYNPLTGALTDNGFLFTAADTESLAGDVTTIQFTNAQALYYDHTNNLLYYAENDAGFSGGDFHATNGVYVVSTTGGNFVPTELTSEGQFPTDNSSGFIDGLTVDVAHNTVYFLTTDTTGSPNNALWWIDTTAAGQTATQIALPAGTLTFAGQVSGEPGGLSFDAQTRQLYVSNQERDPGTPDLSFVTQLQLDNTGHAITLGGVKTFDVASLVGLTPATVDPLDTVGSTSFDILPVLTVNGTTTHAAEQGGFVDLTLSNNSTDQDGDHYAGATVQITGGTFASNETSAADNHLAVLDGGVDKTSGTFTGTNISFTYDSATEKLTLSGYDTIANYNTVLAAVEYKTSGDNPTNGGANTTRTISWTVSDGAQNIPFGAQNSGTTTLTIDATDDAPVNTVPLAQSVLEDHSLAITGVSVSDVDANPASDVITVTLGVTHGTLMVATDVLTGPGAITGNGTGSVTLTGTQNDINATLGEANGLLYGPNPNFNGSDQLTVTTNDQGHTGSGGPLTDTDTVAINVISVNDAPAGADTTVSTSPTTSRVFTAGEFGFSDANDTPANALQAVKITTTPAAGSLTDNGITVAAGQFVSVADINGGHLVFTPGAGASGANYANFTFQVQDDGGTANGGVNLDQSPNTVTINIENGPVIDAGDKTETGSVTELGAPPFGPTGSTTLDQTTGTIHFSDTNLADVNVSSASLISTVWSSGGTVPAATVTALQTALATALTENAGSGSVDWTFAVEDHNLDFLGTNETLTITYQVTVDNQHGGSDTATVTITATGTNDAELVNPASKGALDTAAPDAGTVVASGNAITDAGDSDPDLTDTLTVSAVNGSNANVGNDVAGAFGTLHLNANGSYAYTANAAFDALAAGLNPDQFTFTVIDGHGSSVDTTLTFNITGTNDAPVVVAQTASAADTAAKDSGTVVTTGAALTGDSDAEGNPLTVSLVKGSADGAALTVTAGGAVAHGAFGDLTINPDGTYSYQANPAFDALKAGQNPTDQFSFTVSDGLGGNTATTLTINITGANDTPVVVTESNSATDTANADAGTVAASATAATGALAGDSDRDNDTLAVTLVQGAADVGALTVTAGGAVAHGTFGDLTINPDGSYSYTANTNFDALTAGQTPADLFSFTVSDGHGADIATTLTFNITGANDNPVVVAQTASAADTVNVDAGIVVASAPAATGVLNGDSDAEGNSLTVSLVQGAADGAALTVTAGGAVAHGSFGDLTLNPDGSYSYVANAAFDALAAGQNPTDVFSFTVSDGHGGASATTLTINITGAHDNPVVVAQNANALDTAAPDAGTVVASGNALTGDSGSLTVTAVNGSALNVGTGVAGAFGTLNLAANGTYSYTATAAFDGQQAGQNPTDQFTFTVDDGQGGTASTTLTIHITGANDTALISGTTSQTVVEAGGIANGTLNTPTATATLTDTDADNPANTFKVEAGTGDNGFGTFTMTAGGTWTYTLDNTNPTVEALRTSGQSLTDSFTVHTADGTAQLITIPIRGDDDAPVANDDFASATEAGGVNNGTPGVDPSGNVLTNDTDVDSVANGETKAVITTGALPGLHGTLTLAADGSYTYAVNNNDPLVQALRTFGQTLTDTISYTMTDAAGLTASANLIVTIHGANDAPVAVNDVASATEAGGLNNGTPGVDPSGNVLTNDSDVDSAANGETKAATTAGTFVGAHGTLTLGANGAYTYAVNNNDVAVQALRLSTQTLTETFNYTMTDAAGLHSSASLTITIYGANDAPIAHADTGTAVAAGGLNSTTPGSPAFGNVLTNDTDVDSVANGETKSVAAPGIFAGAHGFLALGANGAYIYVVNENDPAVLALNGPQTSITDTFTYTVKDAAGLTSTATLTITIDGQVRLAPPPNHGDDHGHDDHHDNDDHHHGDSFGMVTNVQGGNNGFPGFSGLGFTPGNAVYAIRADLDPTVGLDGKLDFKLPLLALEAPLGGDIVSVTATLADGRPLPSWLHFDGSSGQFAGLVPDNLLTGSLPPTAGGVPGGGAGTGAMAVPDTLTIEVVARNAKGDISILEFTIDLTGKNPVKTGRHGWNLPNGRTFDPWAIERQRGGLAAHRDVAIPASWDGASDALPHGRGHDADRPAGHQVPAGRAGLSAQLATLGTRGIDAGRTALLDSLRHSRP